MLQTSLKIRSTLPQCITAIFVLACATLIFSFKNKDEKPGVLRSNTKIVLVVDAAHGGTDMGSVFGEYVEKDISLKVARRISALAAIHNIEVLLTRSSDENPLSLDERVDYANRSHPDYFISLHVSDDSDKQMANYQALVTKNAAFSDSWRFGAMVLRQLLLSLGMGSNDLIMKTQGLHILRKNSAPGILLDLGNIRNEAQMQLLADDNKLDEVCNAILNGVVNAHK